MNIIIEGPDNAGKSTLAAAIAHSTGWIIKEKEGRPPTFPDVVAKMQYYLGLDQLIIDRHPIISQHVFGRFRNDPPVPDHLWMRFEFGSPFIIYCRCINKGLDGHEASPTDTPAHLSNIATNYDAILAAYDEVMIKMASIVYTDYEQLPRVVAMVRGVVGP